jgi:hypothetical protein
MGRDEEVLVLSGATERFEVVAEGGEYKSLANVSRPLDEAPTLSLSAAIEQCFMPTSRQRVEAIQFAQDYGLPVHDAECWSWLTEAFRQDLLPLRPEWTEEEEKVTGLSQLDYEMMFKDQAEGTWMRRYVAFNFLGKQSGQALPDFMWEVLALRLAIDLWDAIVASRGNASTPVLPRIMHTYWPETKGQRRDYLMSRCMSTLMLLVEDHTRGAQPAVLFDTLSNLPTSAREGRFAGIRFSTPVYSLKPGNILMALWMQFVHAMQTGTNAHRICPGCNKLFLPARSNQEFDNEACGSKYRARQWRLARKG